MQLKQGSTMTFLILMVTLGLFTLSFGGGISTAVAAAQAEEPTTHDVTVTGSDFVFTPVDVSINVGDTVYFHWTNTSSSHNVAESESSSSDSYKAGGFRSGDTSSTVDFNVTFNDVGTFYFICEPHAGMGMKGSIEVVDPGTSSQSDTSELGDSIPGFTTMISLLSILGAVLVSRRRTIR